MQDPLTSSFRWGETFDTAPCVKGYSIVVLTTTDAQTVRPYFKFAEWKEIDPRLGQLNGLFLPLL